VLVGLSLFASKQLRAASSAGYVDRILKGAKSAELPVHTPIKLELIISLKTAKAFGIAISPSLRSFKPNRWSNKVDHFWPMAAARRRSERVRHLTSAFVRFWQIVLQKSFWGVQRKFLEPLMRFARGDVRDHIG
jgi:hypothetical protein